MSSVLIDRNSDLRQLRNEGYNIVVQNGYLVVKDIPYVNRLKEVKCDGVLITELELSGDNTISPSRHQIRFKGESPYNEKGEALDYIRPHPSKFRINESLEADFEFSNKALGGYKNYYEKVKNYATLLCGPASVLNSKSTPLTFRVESPDDDDESPFRYIDTASTRAEISSITSKLAFGKVAIIGLGGSGSYILDLIAKTPVQEIHLFDGDKFNSHNAFRAPGAASIEELRRQPYKVDYFKDIYERMHRGITAHKEYISTSNVSELTQMDFVFLCVDAGPGKRLVVDTLASTSVNYLDASMGLVEESGRLRGIINVITSTSDNREEAKAKMNLENTDDRNEYDQNIQVADLNALAAQLAVMKWKKMCGFYYDSNNYDHYTFTLSSVRIDGTPAIE